MSQVLILVGAPDNLCRICHDGKLRSYKDWAKQCLWLRRHVDGPLSNWNLVAQDTFQICSQCPVSSCPKCDREIRSPHFKYLTKIMKNKRTVFNSGGIPWTHGSSTFFFSSSHAKTLEIRLWWGISWQSVASPTETSVAAEAWLRFKLFNGVWMFYRSWKHG